MTGADQPGRHVIGLVAGRDFTGDGIIQAAEIRDGDECPVCGNALISARGIEMGHIFQLGRKYAEALDAKVLDVNGKLVTVTMGSYGVGVSRAVAAIAENSHDDRGLIWPREIAPADVHLVIAGKTQEIIETAEIIAAGLDASGIRVMLDDRNASVGVKFTDAELLGVPTICVVGRGVADGAGGDPGPGDRLEAGGLAGRDRRAAAGDRPRLRDLPQSAVERCAAEGCAARVLGALGGPTLVRSGLAGERHRRRHRADDLFPHGQPDGGVGQPGQREAAEFGVVGRPDDHPPGRGGVGLDVLGQLQGRCRRR